MARTDSFVTGRSVAGAICFLFIIAPFLTCPSQTQKQVRTVTIDKSPSAKSPKKLESTKATESSGPAPASHTLLCDLSLLLINDDIGRVRIVAFNGPAGATVNFTTAQTVAGILGMSLTENGPFTSSVVVPVPLDGSGNGQSEVFFVQGLQLGNTVLYATSVEMGNTTVLEYTVLPQCNCPPIPIVP
jgi:hypothetical protein